MTIQWKKVKDARTTTAVLCATALGAGLVPYAPGTMGTLFAVPLAYLSNGWSTVIRIILWVGLTFIGTWAAKVIDEKMGSSDNQSIVIDEVVGYGISAWTAGTQFQTLLAAFVLFRIFDVIKIAPVRQIDLWSKRQSKKSKWLGGFGVIADDILAGFQALAVILLLQFYQLLP